MLLFHLSLALNCRIFNYIYTLGYYGIPIHGASIFSFPLKRRRKKFCDGAPDRLIWRACVLLFVSIVSPNQMCWCHTPWRKEHWHFFSKNEECQSRPSGIQKSRLQGKAPFSWLLCTKILSHREESPASVFQCIIIFWQEKKKSEKKGYSTSTSGSNSISKKIQTVHI